MKWYSPSVKQPPSFAKWIHHLIVFIMIGFIGFITLPVVYLYNSRLQSESAGYQKNQRKPYGVTTRNRATHPVIHGSLADQDSLSGVTKAVIIEDYVKGTKSRNNVNREGKDMG